MSTAQERTLAQHQDFMQLNASAHLLRAAREIGLIDQLRAGQRTAEQLTESLGWAPPTAALMIDALLAIGVIERYGDDLALSRAGHLLCQYDQDLGDAHWSRLVEVVRGDQPRTEHDDQQQSDYLAATQWAHTAAAMQAAEILDVGQGGEYSGLRILDLGCGSAVWSCAIAHRDPESTVTVVDRAGALQAARSTADSIGLTERFEFHQADPLEAEIPGETFDLVLTAQRVSCLDRSSAESFLSKAATSAKAGGRVA